MAAKYRALLRSTDGKMQQIAADFDVDKLRQEVALRIERGALDPSNIAIVKDYATVIASYQVELNVLS